MKVSLAVSLAMSTSTAFAAGSALNCDIAGKDGKVKPVHAKSEKTCTARKGKWVVLPAPAPAAAPAVAPAPAAPVAPAAPAK